MNLRVTRATLLLAIPLALALVSCQRQVKGDDDVVPTGAPSTVEIRFRNVYTPYFDLVLDSSMTIGLSFLTISEFKYYISNVQLISSTTGDTISIPDTYFLIDHKKPESKICQFKAPADSYYGMSFLIGIDDAKNSAGPGTGALNPALGMFWNNTDGYIMAVLEGKIGASKPPTDAFSLHVGGTKAPFSVLGRRYFKLGGAQLIDPTKKTVINMTADAREWFTGPNNTGIGTNPVLNAPGDQAFKVSQNYFKMFDFVSVKFE